ncbi:MAG: fasciclin domain-containing protein [Saprospiraceae bacterium]|nr:fasciclin domain-containing protein [Saprospiraceae bacterium]
MKNNVLTQLILGMLLLSGLSNCTNTSPNQSTATSESSAIMGGGQSTVQDNDSQKDLVKVAIGSADHTTLIAAVKAASLVDVLSNAGPFTVFAPTNAAFEKLPPGTVTDLLKSEKKEVLQDILQYHVAVGVYKTEMLQNGQTLSMANGGSINIGLKDGKIMVNDANIITSIPASNGIIHVIDGVLLPK